MSSFQQFLELKQALLALNVASEPYGYTYSLEIDSRYNKKTQRWNDLRAIYKWEWKKNKLVRRVSKTFINTNDDFIYYLNDENELLDAIISSSK